jgi:hypothetical protein
MATIVTGGNAQRSNTNADTSDNIYYNIKILNDTEQDDANFKIAKYSVNRTVPILENPSEYELAVIRFKVPAGLIPIHIFKPNEWVITLSFDGLDVVQPLLHIVNKLPIDGDFEFGDAIWSYQEFADMMNIAFSTAYTTLKAAKPAAPPTEAPFVTYDGVTKLYTLNAEKLYDETTNTIAIQMNYDLYSVVTSWEGARNLIPPPYINEKFMRIQVKDNFNNSATIGGKAYFTFQQEYTTLALLNSFVSIVFESDSIPVESELLPAQVNNTRQIITDFEPLDGVNDHQSFQFYPQGPLRYYSLKSAYPLSRIDLRVYWTDRAGNEYPILINREEVLTVKLAFRRKQSRQLEHIFGDSDNQL